jgi:hypothetical protein
VTRLADSVFFEEISEDIESLPGWAPSSENNGANSAQFDTVLLHLSNKVEELKSFEPGIQYERRGVQVSHDGIVTTVRKKKNEEKRKRKRKNKN